MKLVDCYCAACDVEIECRLERGEPYPDCIYCGTRMEWMPGATQNFEWGGPRFINGIDQTFASRSDLHAYLKRNGLAQAPEADRHHGAREEYGQLRKAYSFKGQRRRGDYSDRYGRQRIES